SVSLAAWQPLLRSAAAQLGGAASRASARQGGRRHLAGAQLAVSASPQRRLAGAATGGRFLLRRRRLSADAAQSALSLRSLRMAETSAHRNAATPVLLAYAFRPFFLLTGAYGALLIAAWVAFLYAGLPLPLGIAPPAWHAHEMLIGLMPAAIAGFLLTAMCNWTGAAPLRGGGLLALLLLWAAGRLAPRTIRGRIDRPQFARRHHDYHWRTDHPGFHRLGCACRDAILAWCAAPSGWTAGPCSVPSPWCRPIWRWLRPGWARRRRC